MIKLKFLKTRHPGGGETLDTNQVTTLPQLLTFHYLQILYCGFFGLWFCFFFSSLFSAPASLVLSRIFWGGKVYKLFLLFHLPCPTQDRCYWPCISMVYPEQPL